MRRTNANQTPQPAFLFFDRTASNHGSAGHDDGSGARNHHRHNGISNLS